MCTRSRGKKILLSLLSLVFTVALLGAASDPQYGGTIRYAVVDEPAHLDSTLSMSTLTDSIAQHIWDTLFAINQYNVGVPYLVDSYERSADETLVTFKLREGILFHNGDELETEDVVASLERYMMYGSRGAAFAAFVEEITAVDKYTFSIQFNQPYGSMEFVLANIDGGSMIMPKEIAEAAGDTPLTPDQYIGTGPYRFVEWVPGQHIKLARFEGFMPRSEESSGLAGRRNNYLDEIVFVFVSEAATRAAGIKTGEYDYADRMPGDLLEGLRADPNVTVHMKALPTLPVLMFNMKQGLMTNQTLRQATQAALDTDPILLAGFGPLSVVTGAMYPLGTTYYTERGTELYDVADAERARRLMEEAGYNGEEIRFIASPAYIEFYNMALVITQQLESAGFNIDLQIYDWGAWLEHYFEPDLWELSISMHTPLGDPSSFTKFTSSSATWWDTPAKNALFAEFLATADLDRRYNLFEALQGLVYAEVPVVIIGQAKDYSVFNPKFHGFDDPKNVVLNGGSYFFNIWMEQ